MKSLHARIADELMRLAVDVEEQAEIVEEASKEADEEGDYSGRGMSKRNWIDRLKRLDRISNELAAIASDLMPETITLPLEKDEPSDADLAADAASALTVKRGQYPDDEDGGRF